MPDDFGVDRLKDMYRVHDTSKKQKKNKRDNADQEFYDLLRENEKEPEGYESQKQKKTPPGPGDPALLSRLSHSAPPPIIIDTVEISTPPPAPVDDDGSSGTDGNTQGTSS